ncbi:MAG: DUF4369 domain-containing protein [Bacteroidaceae bacterium]|nr:DUF4369 domain-containing protein [Bacteroidaceae bacterium]
MLKYVFLLISPIVALLSACSDQYNIMGNSSVPTYDGNVLYLKVMSGGAPAMAYDSAEVVHGKFGFEGIIDTVCMAQLYMGTSRLLPIVLESGDIQINFTDTEQTVRGGTLNERLYKFLNENARLQNEIQNNTHNMARLIMSGATPAAHLRIERRNEELQDRLDKLWTDFISENSDNVLGPLYFMEYTLQYVYPVITPQIEKIIRHAPESFLSNPDVQSYLRDARFNMRLMQGDF